MSFPPSASAERRRVSCPAVMAPSKDEKFIVPYAEYLLDGKPGILRNRGVHWQLP